MCLSAQPNLNYFSYTITKYSSNVREIERERRGEREREKEKERKRERERERGGEKERAACVTRLIMQSKA